jgi:hypothetical protein
MHGDYDSNAACFRIHADRDQLGELSLSLVVAATYFMMYSDLMMITRRVLILCRVTPCASKLAPRWIKLRANVCTVHSASALRCLQRPESNHHVCPFLSGHIAWQTILLGSS